MTGETDHHVSLLACLFLGFQSGVRFKVMMSAKEGREEKMRGF